MAILIKLLNLDIECIPATAYIWNLRIPGGWLSPDKIITPSRMICLAAKWVGEDRIYFFSDWEHGQQEMARKIWGLLDEADAVLHYNGTRFDIPIVNTEMATAGLTPPSPYAQIDLMKTVKKNFYLMSNSLGYAAEFFGTTRKLGNEGFGLWKRVMAGEEDARQEMEVYNIHDLSANEGLYGKLLPWIPQHPSRALLDDPDGCPQCGGALRPRGYAHTRTGRFRRFRCDSCGGWSRATRRDDFVDIVGI